MCNGIRARTSSLQSNKGTSMIIFTHIQKTCGTSIYNIVRQQPNIVIWRRRFGVNNKRPDFVTGHIPYGVHDDWGTSDYKYATFLRDPIDRWISQFYHGLAKRSPSFHALLQTGCNRPIEVVDYNKLTTSDILKFVKWCIENSINSNIMCKQLSGIESLRNVHKYPNPHGESSVDFGFSQVYGWSARFKKYNRSGSNRLLEESLKNLKENYDFVGLQEKADEHQQLFCDKFGFTMPENGPYHSERTIRCREEELFHNDDCMELLEIINEYDIMLFDDYKNSLKGGVQ